MPGEFNPYDAGPEFRNAAVSWWTRFVAGVVGLIVLLGASSTLGVFLFALLVLNAGRSQPSPIGSAALVETSAQRLILTFGGILVAMLSFALAAYVVSRILKSQRLAAEVVFRRQELQATVAEMQAAVLEQKNAKNLSRNKIVFISRNALASGSVGDTQTGR